MKYLADHGANEMRLLNIRTITNRIVMVLATTSCPHGDIGVAQEAPSFTQGLAQTITPNLFECSGSGSRLSPVGRATSDDGKQWIVAAETHFQTAAKATDLYDECGGIRLRGVADLDLKTVPVVDAGGSEVFTAYLFADNYFELYVNDTLIAVDAVPFTPFNSSVVRFKVSRPFVVAVMVVDWDEHSGLGSEGNRGLDYHPGDAGLVAVIKDDAGQTIAITEKSARADVLYGSAQRPLLPEARRCGAR